MSTYSRLHRAIGALLALLFGALPAFAATDPLAIVPPMGIGPNAVGCSDMAQNLMPAAGNLSDYWEGNPIDGTSHYVSELLTEPADTVSYNVQLPDDSELYSGLAGQSVPFVAIVCYPTDPGNARPDYPLPGEAPVPHMQR
ncbi:MAG: hypothetical protein ABI831_22375, partial [Betaproteobacteria bacterium]